MLRRNDREERGRPRGSGGPLIDARNRSRHRLGVGAGIDWLVKTFPLFTVIGVFAGFALALYAIYLETK